MFARTYVSSCVMYICVLCMYAGACVRLTLWLSFRVCICAGGGVCECVLTGA